MNQTYNSTLYAKNLGKNYGKKLVIRDISIHVKCGEAIGLLGPNGAGKTTCFHIISGLIQADYGSIFIDNYDITNLPMYKRARLGLGYLPQESSIFRSLTVEENLLAIIEMVEKDPNKQQEILEKSLIDFSIESIRKVEAGTLSGGQRRRVEISRALAAKPKFLLLDEPLAGIDPIAIADLKFLLSHLKDLGVGVLITDHNVRETLGIIDRAYIIHDGNVLMEGKPDEIVSDKYVKRFYLGENFTFN